jgi:hypothetical protein
MLLSGSAYERHYLIFASYAAIEILAAFGLCTLWKMDRNDWPWPACNGVDDF